MWVDLFMDYLRYERNFSAQTLTRYAFALASFERYCEEIGYTIDYATMDTDVPRGWMVWLMDHGYRSNTVCVQLSALRTFYRFLLMRGLVQTDPVHALRGPKKEKLLPQFVKEGDLNRLLDGGYFPPTFDGERDRLVVLTFYTTGIRHAELTDLDVADVDVEQGQLKVTGKRRKQRVVPFGPELADAFRSYLEARAEALDGRADTGALFINERSGERMSYSAVGQCVKQALSQVTSIQRRSPHVLRHSFATSMLNHEADLQSVKELLGHESLSTTEVYTHTTFEELKLLYNKAHPRA